MATPKFQYKHKIQDIFRGMVAFNEDLKNETDHPLPAEIYQMVNLLADRDRQLEDYLTNLPSAGGGGGAVAWGVGVYGGTSGLLTYQGATAASTFAGVAEYATLSTLPLTFTNHGLSLSGSTITDPTLLINIQGQFRFTPSGVEDKNSRAYAAINNYFINPQNVTFGNSHNRSGEADFTITCRESQYGTLSTTNSPPLHFVIEQPVGSTVLGAGNFPGTIAGPLTVTFIKLP